MLSNRGFTLIEVLVASVILFLAILTANAAFKQYANYKEKQLKYERIYINVLSLVNEIDNFGVKDFANRSGEINGMDYKVTVKPVAARRNYVYGVEQSVSGNRGKFTLVLYKIVISIGGKSFTYYRTEFYKKR